MCIIQLFAPLAMILGIVALARNERRLPAIFATTVGTLISLLMLPGILFQIVHLCR